MNTLQVNNYWIDSDGDLMAVRADGRSWCIMQRREIETALPQTRLCLIAAGVIEPQPVTPCDIDIAVGMSGRPA